MSGGEVSDECGPVIIIIIIIIIIIVIPVHGDEAALGAGEGDRPGQHWRDPVLEVDDEVVRPVLGGHHRGADVTLVGGGDH